MVVRNHPKHLMVLFTQDFCPYCEALINKNLTQQSIRDSLKTNFDIVQLNMWGDREVFDIHGNPTTEKQIAADLDVQFTPTLIFFDRDGEPALRTNGYLSSNDMQASLDFVASQAYHHNGGDLFCDVIQNILWRGGAQRVARISQSDEPFNHVKICGEVAAVG